MKFYIQDEATVRFVAQLARRLGVSDQEAVRLAVLAELERTNQALTVRERLERFWRENPMPPKAGLPADKAFFDNLSGEAA